jgi:DNA-binding winged helix-turn-helix (wHTH) protein
VRIRFGLFTLDDRTRQLLKGDRTVALSPKAFELLMSLAARRPEVLSKAELHERLWPRTFVSEANLSNLVAEVRSALGDRAQAPRYIRTAYGFGYAFCSDTVTVDKEPVRSTRASCWLEWGRRRFPLFPGSYVVGRDADADIRLESTTVSRRHARIVVSDERMTLEDVGSKNGTYRGTEQVIDAVPLADGDSIRIGSVVVTFVVRAPGGSTETLVSNA